MPYSSNKSNQTSKKEETAYPPISEITSPMGSIFLRKKIDTQKEVSHESSTSCGRYGDDYAGDNFYLFSPPDFTLDERVGKGSAN